jgi:hypothetical protein
VVYRVGPVRGGRFWGFWGFWGFSRFSHILAILDISGTGRIWESWNRGLAKKGIIKVARFFRFFVWFQPLFGNAFKEKIFAMKKIRVKWKFLGGCAFQNNIWKNYGKGNAIRMHVGWIGVGGGVDIGIATEPCKTPTMTIVQGDLEFTWE